MKKLLAICASPRQKGSSNKLLEALIKGAKSKGIKTEKLYISKLKISPCIEKSECYKTGTCIIKDDMTRIYKKIKDLDIIAIATPIFFASIPAQLKAMIDRCQSLWVSAFMLNKPIAKKGRRGVLLAVAASSRKDFFENAKLIVRAFFKTAGIKYYKELFVPNIENPEDIKQIYLKKVYNIGRSL